MARSARKPASKHDKRAAILEAARHVFESEGLEGASLRSIATAAGYTPAALYFHFDSKEALYAELLHGSIATCVAAVAAASSAAEAPSERFRAGAMAFFDFYAANPRDLDLGFYLFRGGMKPKGLGRERDRALNAAFAETLAPIAAAARAMGASETEAGLLTADVFAHAVGLLLLAHTGRIRMFGAAPAGLMEKYLDDRIAALKAG